MSRTGTTQEEPSASDLQARRLVGLMVTFSNTPVPLTSEEIRRAHYPELTSATFLRQFSRDRQRLAEVGLVITRERHGTDEALWIADAASFADTRDLAPEDALMIDILCAPLASDPAFAQRSELRHALAKIDGAFGEVTAARIAPQDEGARPALATLLAALDRRHLVQMRYIDAQGRQSERTWAPFGTFGLRDHTYIVCALVGEDGQVRDGELRTLRDDRLVRVQELRRTFEVPEDFSALDFRRLPFQIGPNAGMARFRATPTMERTARAELERCATPVESENAVWDAPMSDLLDAAVWSIAEAAVPLAPPELVEARAALLERGARLVPHAAWDRAASVDGPRDPRAGTPGRRSSLVQTRELMALVGSLGDQGSSISVSGISSRLGISPERARELLSLVLSASSGSSAQLPLGLSDDEEKLVLCFSRGARGRQLRLTSREMAALDTALDTLGFLPDDPLRVDLSTAFAPSLEALSPSEARERIVASVALETTGPDTSDCLEACSRALIDEAGLSFDYRNASSDDWTRRSVRPMAIQRSEGWWYLDAFDQLRHANRTFRLDRMRDVRVTHAPEPTEAVRVEHARMVHVFVSNEHLLELLEWPRLVVEGRSDGTVVASLPYYGGQWLPRRIAACGGEVTSDDEELVASAREVATSLLEDR